MIAKSSINKIRFFFFCLNWFCYYGHAAVQLPALFADHMVLQQKTQVSFWGWGSPGEDIFIKASWQDRTVYTKADGSGNWKINLETPAAGGPFHIKVKGENSIEISDVLIGEVWLCSGQSNMTFPLKYSDSAKQEIANANFPGIRYFEVERQYGAEPFKDCKGSWKITSSETAASFSAVAYYFAIKIHRDLTIPVGIVCAGWGGTPAEAWTQKAVLQQEKTLHYFLQRWKEIPGKVGADSINYRLALQQWQERNKTGITDLLKPEEPRSYYYYSKPWCGPGVLFNGMIHPLIPFSFKGVLWYQGESNVSESHLYQQLFTALIKNWRQQWSKRGEQKLLPFYFVQIAPYRYADLESAAKLREAQYEVSKTVDHTGMVVTTDVGEMDNLHFSHKKEVGERLALLALAKAYEFKNLVYQGPYCTKVSQIKNRLQLRFDQHLITANHKRPGGFEIGYKNAGGDSMVFIHAEAEINGVEVMVWNDVVKDPIMVRYAWLEAGEANLINKSGLPAAPFQKKTYHK